MSGHRNFWKAATQRNIFVQVIVIKILFGNNSLESQIVKYVHLRPSNVNLI